MLGGEVDAAAEGQDAIRFQCVDCAETFELCLRDGEDRRCLDCRADVDRAVNGWTPENSLS